MMEQANEVQEVLGRTYGVPDLDEDELEAGEFQRTFFFDVFLFSYSLFHNRIGSIERRIVPRHRHFIPGRGVCAQSSNQRARRR